MNNKNLSQLFEQNNLRLDHLFHLGAMMGCEDTDWTNLGDQVLNYFDRYSAKQDFNRATQLLEAIPSLKTSLGMYPAVDQNDFMNILVLDSKLGFLGVFTSPYVENESYDWSYTVTGYFYGETFEELVKAAVEGMAKLASP